MLRQKKVQAVDKIEQKLHQSTVALVTDYRGMTAIQMTELRRRYRQAGCEFRVVKNTLARFAGEKAGKKGIEELFTGPTAIVFSYDDVVKPAQLLTEYIRSTKSVMKIKGGLMGDRLLGPDDVSRLSALPPRDILISQLLAEMQSPISHLLNVLNAPLRGLSIVLQARIQKMEGEKDSGARN